MTIIFTKPLVVLIFCLALGFLIGRVKLRILNSTLATLLVAIAANMVLRRLDIAVNSLDEIKSLGFAFFAFALGFSAGPRFVDTLYGEKVSLVIRQTVLAFLYAGIAFVVVLVLKGPLCHIVPSGKLVGLLAGALTQTTILEQGANSDASASVTYVISYPIGLLGMMFFVQNVAPFLMRLPLVEMVRRYLDGADIRSSPQGFHIPSRFVQMRAYRVVEKSSPMLTMGALEAAVPRHFEVVAVYSGGEVPMKDITQDTPLDVADVVVVVGDMRVVKELSPAWLEEVADERYLSSEFVLADIVLARAGTEVFKELTGKGVLLRAIVRNGRILPECRFNELRVGDVLRVAGLARPVAEFTERNGYLRDAGAQSDFFSVTLAIAVAIVVGAIPVFCIAISNGTVKVTMGTGCCALVLGLLLGWMNHRRPDIAHVPSSALSFIRTVGLNVFICAMALKTPLALSDVFGMETLNVMFWALFVAIVPLVGTFVVGLYVFRMSSVALLGGLRGCGTCIGRGDGLVLVYSRLHHSVRCW